MCHSEQASNLRQGDTPAIQLRIHFIRTIASLEPDRKGRIAREPDAGL